MLWAREKYFVYLIKEKNNKKNVYMKILFMYNNGDVR